jgi:ABC-type multidrug transport system permease subunit
VSIALINSPQEFFGLKAEQISIESTESLIENAQNLILFINERRGDITLIKNESMTIKNDLIERKAKLEQTREDFLPLYYELKDLQVSIHNYSDGLQNTTDDVQAKIQDVLLLLDTIPADQYTIPPLPVPLENETAETIINVTSPIDELRDQLFLLSYSIDQANSNITEMVTKLDETIIILDGTKVLLDEEINRTDIYIQKIDASIDKIDDVDRQLEEKLGTIDLPEGLAEKLAKPITQEYNILLKNAKNIQISFPQLAVLIIMFIALLFSNIATLMEINDKAYLRNIVAPVNDTLYVVGMLFTSIVIIFFQVLVLFAVAQTKFGVKILPMFWQLSLISVILITFFVLTGMIFAYLFRTVQSSVLITTFFVLLFFLFSSTVSAIETMPAFARFLSSHNPLVLGEYLIKEVQLFHTPLSALSSTLWMLAAYILALFVILLVLAKYRNKSRA